MSYNIAVRKSQWNQRSDLFRSISNETEYMGTAICQGAVPWLQENGNALRFRWVEASAKDVPSLAGIHLKQRNAFAFSCSHGKAPQSLAQTGIGETFFAGAKVKACVCNVSTIGGAHWSLQFNWMRHWDRRVMSTRTRLDAILLKDNFWRDVTNLRVSHEVATR